MIQERIAARYARSVYELASERNQTDAVLKDFRGLQDLLEQSRDLQLFIQSPIIPSEKKIPVFKEIFQGNIHEVIMLLIELLTRREREEVLGTIGLEYIKLYNKSNNIRPVRLSAATELEDQQVQEIKTLLEKELSATIQITPETDPELIGGVVLNFGDKVLDASVRHALRNARRNVLKDSDTFIEKI